MSLDVYLIDPEEGCVFEYNCTHNLNKMAAEVEIYKEIWRPEEINCFYAKDVSPALSKALIELCSYPDCYKRFNPENGWGTYEGLVKFIAKYLDACLKFPEAKIEVSR